MADTFKSINEFTESSTIHAVNYIGRKEIHWFERIFWIAAFLISLLTCTYLIRETYVKWDNDPVIVTFNDRSTPILEIPFPAVTICPQSKFNEHKLKVEETRRRKSYKGLMDHIDAIIIVENCGKYGNPKNVPRSKYLDRLRRIQEDFPNHCFSRIGRDSNVNAFKENNGFKEIVTSEGICYSFNFLPFEDLYQNIANDSEVQFYESDYIYEVDASLENDSNESDDENEEESESLKGNATDEYDESAEFEEYEAPNNNKTEEPNDSKWTIFGYGENSDPISSYPKRVFASGIKSGLEVFLKTRNDISTNSECEESFAGFKIALHTPDEIPSFSDYITIPYGTRTLISVKPRVITTSQNLKDYSPAKRQCYFEGEHKLRFFKHYNLGNCKLECLSEFVFKACGCVRTSMIHLKSTLICGDLWCPIEAEDVWRVAEYAKSISKEETEYQQNLYKLLKDQTFNTESFHRDRDTLSNSCDCLPACSSITYDPEVSQVRVDVTFAPIPRDYNEAVVNIFFKEDSFIESRRSELYGWTSFLSSCGGFLGLLMGGSLLSLVEIFYHLTLKQIFKRKNQQAVGDSKALKTEASRRASIA